MNPHQGVTPSFEISVMQFSKTTFIKLFVTLGYAFVGYSHRFRRRTCHTVSKLIEQESYMIIQTAVLDCCAFVIQRLKHLGEQHGYQEVECAVSLRDNCKETC